MRKEKKIDELRETLDSGVITRKEFENQKKRIESEPEIKAKSKKKEEENIGETEIKKSDKIFLISIFGLILVIIIFFSFRVIDNKQPITIEDMHILNLKGKLKPDLGYVYNDAYSFINFEDLWYIQLQSPRGTRLYNMALRYGPRDLEDIQIKGRLNTELFNDALDYYVTFDPTGNDFSHVALAVGDFNQHMTNTFFKTPIAACDRNKTSACDIRPIITCENTDKFVLYVKEAIETNVYYDDNCIIVEGEGFELVKGVDRVLLNLYGIMEQ